MIYRKEGATLAEICIVLAVVSIISLVVVSFVTMTNGRSAASTAKLNAIDDLELVESLVDNWFAAMTKNGGRIEYNGTIENNNIQFNDGETIAEGRVSGSIRMKNRSQICVLLPGEEAETVYSLKTVKGLRFAQMPVPDENYGGTTTADILYFCTVAYIYRMNGKEITQYYTFCVNPRVGEVITKPEI